MRPLPAAYLPSSAQQQGYEALEETFKTVYLFNIAVRTVEKKWTVRKRFSHFAQLWMQVEEAVQEEDKAGVVVFPSKNLASFGYLDEEGLDRRLQDLQQFMKALLETPLPSSTQKQISIFLLSGATQAVAVTEGQNEAEGQAFRSRHRSAPAMIAHDAGASGNGADGAGISGENGGELKRIFVRAESAEATAIREAKRALLDTQKARSGLSQLHRAASGQRDKQHWPLRQTERAHTAIFRV